VPAGFADGVDNDTTYSASGGLDLTAGVFSIANNGVTDAMIQGVDASKIAGQVNNSQISDLAWSKLTGVPADLADGDADTTYSAGSGLTLGGTTFSITNNSITNAMIVGMDASKLIGQIGDSQISAVDWSKLTNVPADLADGDQIGATNWSNLPGIPAGFSDGIDNDTTYTAGAGLSLSSGAFAIAASGVQDSMIAGMSASKLIGTVAGSQIAANAIDSSKIADGSVATADIGDGQVTAAKVANRSRRFGLSGNMFSPSSTSTFDFGNQSTAANRTMRVTSFGGANSNGYLTVSFVVPADYVGPTAADLTAIPGIITPRLTLKWCTDSTQANGSRKVNFDVSFTKDTEFTAIGATRFRYNLRSGVGPTETSAAESADPSNVQVATQVIPEVGDNWSTGEGPNTAWAPGDVIVLTIARNATSAEDPNSARAGIIAVTFEYEADQ
jgi:hypothetical protein